VSKKTTSQASTKENQGKITSDRKPLSNQVPITEINHFSTADRLSVVPQLYQVNV